MNRLRGQEIAAAPLAVIVGLGVVACGEDGSKAPSICQIDMPVDSGSMLSHGASRAGETYSGYNFARNESLRLVYGEEDAKVLLNELSEATTVTLGDLTVRVYIDGESIKTECST